MAVITRGPSVSQNGAFLRLSAITGGHNRGGESTWTVAMAEQRASSHRYAVVAPPPATWKIVAAFAAALAASGLSVVLARSGHGSAMYGSLIAPALWVATAGAAFALVALCLLQWRRSVAIESGMLVVRAGLNTRRIPVAAIELERARIVDLERQAELLPGRRKTLGASLPGYQTGWFHTRQWGKGFYLLTERRRVLWLPERDGPHLLLSLHQPQVLLAALNALVPRRDPDPGW